VSSLLKILFTVSFVVILFWFILINRASVPVSFAPLWGDFSLPFGGVIFLSVLFGFIWGALIVWFNGASIRNDYRKKKKELKKLVEQTGNTI
jgi:uncharacterized integral membrane protein